MAFSLKLPDLFGFKSSANLTGSAETLMDDLPAEEHQEIQFGKRFRQYPINRKLQILGGLFIVVISAIGVMLYQDNKEATFNTAYVATAGDMRMLSQRLAKASSLAMEGDPHAFKQLYDSHNKFATNLEMLRKGGVLFGITVPPSPDNVQPQLQALAKIWETTDKNALLQLSAMEVHLFVFGMKSRTIIENNARLLDLSERIAVLKLQTGAGAREVAAANQLVTLTQRIAKNINALRGVDLVGSEIPQELGRDTQTFRELLTGLIKGSETLRLSATTDAETVRKLGELEEVFKDYQNAVNDILVRMPDLVAAKQSGSSIFNDSEALLEATDALTNAYQNRINERAFYGISLSVLIGLALMSLSMMAMLFLDDSRLRAEIAEQSKRESETINRQNQDAILRLMNELGDLADGDLTVTATVSEDITGAIADSINYTVEELRVLVGRINDAASRVTLATEIARQTSAELLDAAKRQSTEIQDAGHSVLAMASSMTKVSDEANQSAQVARQSLAAAGKGTQAVQDSINGMNGIREQIQETSKRIKRLGESSQEIGEIVELISDITEQTNVLALNAAIQAASAGDAGRGFTVVAEEVQRLAERSGEATKQIAAIVKTIQTDTQGAVSAMEESTRGVVEGAKLSDAAGQALAEIGEVSQNLADLIKNISDATRHQADSATGVAGKMQDILHVTEQTTAGTQKTAMAVGELAGLATELKGSVAGFKVG